MTQLRVPSAEFRSAFGQRPLLVEHDLADHPLLTTEAVADLADRLAVASVEHNRGSLPSVVADGVVETVDETPGEGARGIDTNGAWMVLKNVQADGVYRALLDEMLDQVAPDLDPREGVMRHREGFVFLSSPN